jgi:hypothetical protein
MDFNNTSLCDCDPASGTCRKCGVLDLFCGSLRACPASPKTEAISAPAHPPAHGPGTELKRLLARVGIAAAPDCACNARAAEMDRQGVEWCEANVDTIVGWLREQATARGLPFLDAAGRFLIKRAIKNARKSHIDP